MVRFSITRLLFIVAASSILLSGCGKSPSSLTCSVWEEKRKEAASFVDFWAQFKVENLSTQEKIDSARAYDLYLEVIQEMDSLGCKY